jgi:DNA-binding transcriptional LysR family regulator
MNRLPDWEGYRVLVAIADHGSFSRAATELGISQPTVSRRIEDLERALASRLLIRRSRGAVPTPAGERVLTEARAMARSAGSAARLATGESAPQVRRIAISATEGLGTLWLPHRLTELERPAGLRIDLVIDNAASDLSSRHADIAIRLFRPRQPDLVARRVGSLGFGLFASPAYLAARGTPRRLGDLARHDHVDFLDRGARPPSYVRWLRRIVPADRFLSSASSLLAMHELARAGRGIVLGTSALLSGDRHLVRLLPRARPPDMDIWLAVHADVRRDPDVLRVVDTLEAIFQRESTALS